MSRQHYLKLEVIASEVLFEALVASSNSDEDFVSFKWKDAPIAAQ